MGERSVGIVVNPDAGKDVRRLTSRASQTPDVLKIDVVRRVAVAAVEAGADTIYWAGDGQRLAGRALDRMSFGRDVRVEPLAGSVTGTRADTVGAAAELRERGAAVVVVLGGDGTCRDAAAGWPDLPLIAISTGTNNIYPAAVDGTSAGTAAGLVAAGTVPIEHVAQPTKQIIVRVSGSGVTDHIRDHALVEVALVDPDVDGARSVAEPQSIRTVVAAIGDPASTGLSSIAGRIRPVDRHTRGGVHITLDPEGRSGRRVRVPLVPGRFDTLAVTEVRPLADGEVVDLRGPGVLAFDGERDIPIAASATAMIWIERTGPRIVDVDRTLHLAAGGGAFDA